MFRQSIDIAAEHSVLFDMTQDYEHRLAWDPFLKEARLLAGAAEPSVGVKAWCVAKFGIGMETRYVSFNPPRACAVEMTRGPWFLRSFAGSWRFDAIGEGRARVSFSYSLVARPTFLNGLLRFVFAREVSHRLEALKQAAELSSTHTHSRIERFFSNGSHRA
jgi:ribosome-associated toxin RatA of RatAB toxin-antitoxin module